MWQSLHEELKRDLDVITVAVDVGGMEAARPWIEAAHATHPSLVDQHNVVASLFGFVNVPSAVWIDEAGMITRPAHTPVSGVAMASTLAVEPRAYLDALGDWAVNGAASRFALSLEQRRRRLHRPSGDEALAAVHFRLGEYLASKGLKEEARPYIEEAKRLAPHNWTYRRQAWVLYEPAQNMGRGWYDAAVSSNTPYYPALQLTDEDTMDEATLASHQREQTKTRFGRFFAPEEQSS